MESPDLLTLFVDPIHQADFPYMIVGSVASIHYGEPRYTADIDLAITLAPDRVPEIPVLFPEPDYYCPPEEVLLVESQHQERAHFNIIHIPSGLKADCYPCRQQPYFKWAMTNRRKLEISNHHYWFAPPEYVILWKLIFFREGHSGKHLRDIRSILAVQGNAIDLPLLASAIEELSLTKEWRMAKDE